MSEGVEVQPTKPDWTALSAVQRWSRLQGGRGRGRVTLDPGCPWKALRERRAGSLDATAGEIRAVLAAWPESWGELLRTIPDEAPELLEPLMAVAPEAVQRAVTDEPDRLWGSLLRQARSLVVRPSRAPEPELLGRLGWWIATLAPADDDRLRQELRFLAAMAATSAPAAAPLTTLVLDRLGDADVALYLTLSPGVWERVPRPLQARLLARLPREQRLEGLRRVGGGGR